MKQTVSDYINLPYTIEVIPDENCFFIKIKELEGCISQGDTIEEAFIMIKDALSSWLEVAIEEGDEIPLPESMQEYKHSGKMSLRMPKSLHKKVAKEAKKEGVSLNSYIVSCLSESNTLNMIKRIYKSPENISADVQTSNVTEWFNDYKIDYKSLMKTKNFAMFNSSIKTNNMAN